MSKPRESTRAVKVGNIQIGGQDKVVVQSMCSIKTSKVEEVAKEIKECRLYGAEIMRLSVLDEEDARSFKEIKRLVDMPLVADIHFDHRLGILALENGADALRANPGNIKKEGLEALIEASKKHRTPIRIGVNGGSLKGKYEGNPLYGEALEAVKLFEGMGFHDLVLSLKGSDVLSSIEAYRLASKNLHYPLHIGITEAGPKDIGLIRSAAGLSPLLLDGIGDTMRISLSDSPAEEIKASKRLLRDLGLDDSWPYFISCPTCGRTEVDLLPLSKKISEYLESHHINKKIAVMGCIVNGPGEAKEADLGVAGGKGKWVMFKKGEVIKRCDDSSVYDDLITEINKL